jgi:hypothetical protein
MAKSIALFEMLNTVGMVHTSYKDSWSARPFSIEGKHLVLRNPDTPFDEDTCKHLVNLGWYQMKIVCPNDEDWYYAFEE